MRKANQRSCVAFSSGPQWMLMRDDGSIVVNNSIFHQETDLVGFTRLKIALDSILPRKANCCLAHAQQTKPVISRALVIVGEETHSKFLSGKDSKFLITCLF